jgi:hypothetical protein
MCCGTESQHSAWQWARHHGSFCGCGALSHYGPRFMTKEQKIARLEEYLEGLRGEAKAVEEHIAEMKEEK